MAHYDFDRVIDRRGTGCEKWDFMEAVFKAKDLVPLWVADMDFASPPEVVRALVRRAEHGVFGYTGYTDGYFNAVTGWMLRRHGWEIRREWVVPCPGVVPALNALVRTFTRPGDRVIVQQPVYHPFMLAAENNGRRVINNELRLDGGRYVMDLDDLEKKAAAHRARMLILCSPHNPVGRLWTRGELEELGRVCADHGLLVVSDEIHSDLVLGGRRHVPFASVSDALAARSVVCTAPSKTFNLAGLQTANLIIPDAKLRAEYIAAQEECGFFSANAFGAVALEAAYAHGEEWLDALIGYIEANLRFLADYITDRLPGVRLIEPEATYLAWLDFRDLGMDSRALKDFLRRRAAVALGEGHIFGRGGEGFARVNMACPRALLEEGFDRLERAVKAL